MSLLCITFFSLIFVIGGDCTNSSVVHHDPLDVLREMVDLSGIMADTARNNIKPSLHMLVAGSLLRDSQHVDQHWNTFVVMLPPIHPNPLESLVIRVWFLCSKPMERITQAWRQNSESENGSKI